MNVSMEEKELFDTLLKTLSEKIESVKSDVALQITSLKEIFDSNLTNHKESVELKIEPMRTRLNDYYERHLEAFKRIGEVEKEVEKLKLEQGNDNKATERRSNLITGIISGVVVGLIVFIVTQLI